MFSPDLQDSLAIHPDPSTLKIREPQDHLLLFHITGNPGLAEYYRPFLTLCYDSLRDHLTVPKIGKQRRIAVHIQSISLAGFELSSRPPASLVKLHGPGPYSLAQQVDHIDLALARAIDAVETLKRPNETVKVVLVGHSVGAFILLEVLSRRRERARRAGPKLTEASIIGGVCLFPTVVDLSKSPRGRIFGWVLMIPRLVFVAALFAKLLTFWIPAAILQWVLHTLNGMPAEAAHTTAAFIKSTTGVTQALYLAKDELSSITTDRWDDDLWGVTKESKDVGKRTKLFFLFGQNDYWVADETRDQLIAARASSGEAEDAGKPVMNIDDGGVGHSFCLTQNEPVARRVVEYVQQIVQTNWR